MGISKLPFDQNNEFSERNSRVFITLAGIIIPIICAVILYCFSSGIFLDEETLESDVNSVKLGSLEFPSVSMNKLNLTLLAIRKNLASTSIAAKGRFMFSAAKNAIKELFSNKSTTEDYISEL